MKKSSRPNRRKELLRNRSSKRGADLMGTVVAVKSPVWFLVLLVMLCVCRGDAQIPYASGQNVVPVYEGWEKNPDGSFNMVFGYMNRNYEEQVEIPIGAQNMFEPGPPDRGQPTHFYQRRQEFVFKVKVPADWGDKDLIWTL